MSCGAQSLNVEDTNEQRLAISQIINHPNYNKNTQENDIALLKLTGSFTCSQNKIYPACLPSSEVRQTLLIYIEKILNTNNL